MRQRILAGIVLSLMVLMTNAASAASFRPLGNLGGNTAGAAAFAVSANGSLVSGRASSRGDRAFIWTATTGMSYIGNLPNGSVTNTAYAVSASGSDEWNVNVV